MKRDVTKSSSSLLQKPIVLLVDDCEDQLTIFEFLLRGENYDVVTAQSAGEALDVLEDIHVDAVVSDVFMPEVSGKEFVENVRRVQGQSDLPVISFSAAEEDMSDALLEAGADAFVPKKYARTKLAPQIAELLAAQERNNALIESIQRRFRS